jgi:dephospho-CoA kinase
VIVLGLTGSIGMGKSTTARMFADEGVPVHDADAAVHRLYEGRAAPLVGAAFPGTVIAGVVDRARLAAAVLNDRAAMSRLEAIVHPLVREEEREFLERHRRAGAPLVVLDIPLLFETGAEDRVDRIAVVTADAAEQRRRVLSRPGMTEEKFAAILARQVADSEKRARADFLIDTGRGFDHARAEVRAIIRSLTGKSRL